MKFLEKRTYIVSTECFDNVPGRPFAYWVGDSVFKLFVEKQSLYETHAGITTGDNDYFLKSWYEINSKHIYRDRVDIIPAWYFHHKGGAYRKWYGNNELIIHYDEQSIREMKKRPGFRHDGRDFYFRECATWNKTSTGSICVRYSDAGYTFNTGGCCLFTDTQEELYYCIALLNSCVMRLMFSFLCPTFSFAAGDVAKAPIIYNQDVASFVSDIVKQEISISKEDWDSVETSYDFKSHPLICSITNVEHEDCFVGKYQNEIADTFKKWTCKREIQFNLLKSNEEELNRIFIKTYKLQDELVPEEDDKDVTVRKADLVGDIKSLISYAVGCMFGRYSLDEDGLIYAGGEWNDEKYKTFIPDEDNCIPITDENYFSDDIVGRFVEFVRAVYGDDTLEENLSFVADALGGNGEEPRNVIRKYFLNDFFKDHCKTYSVTGSGKRPIYWLFDSGKQNGFKALVYMHRWNSDTIATVRASYVTKVQEKYENELRAIDLQLDHLSDPRQKALQQKRKEKIVKQVAEIKQYDELISHLALEHIDIDLDDGVKVNHEKVQHDKNGDRYGILAPIK